MELKQLPLDLILRNPDQPRKHFPEAELMDLAESIREVGVAQPILVRPYGNRYMITAGERRWRAAALAQLASIPAIVRTELSSRQESLTRLIENLQRSDLSPIEIARYVHYLREEEGLTQEQVAVALGRKTNRSAVAHYLRLLQLPVAVQEMIDNGLLQFGHGKVLCGAEPARQKLLADQVVSKKLSVRQLEALISSQGSQRKQTSHSQEVRDALARMETGASEVLGYPLKIQHSDRKNSGKVVVEYNSLDELDGIMEKIGYDGDA